MGPPKPRMPATYVSIHLTDGSHSIIAVTGLDGHAIGSWKAKGSSDVWLRDWLPMDIPSARVILYGYETALKNSKSKASVEELGQMMFENVTTFRKDTGVS